MKDYKKILEGVVNIINTTEKSDIGFANICTYIGEKCPELAESEDEKIRKMIINHLTQERGSLSNEEAAEALAWLEKQKNLTDEEYEQGKKDVLWCINQAKKNAKDENEMGTCWFAEKWLEKQKEPELSEDLGDYIAELSKQFPEVSFAKLSRIAVRVKNWLEKQDERKSTDKPKFEIGDEIKTDNEVPLIITKIDEQGYWSGDLFICSFEDSAKWELVGKIIDKVEPKFKVGDFIVNDYCAGKVIALTDDAYLLDTGQGIPFSYEYNARLWTIEDAKDGDVLATKDTVFIFKHIDKAGLSLCKSYCEVIGNSELGLGFDFSINNVHPATKEQRDTLFAKMKEEGYEWSEETHELKKISQRIISSEAKEALYDKPAWSEEDMKEALRTEYEKGRADGIAEMKKHIDIIDKDNIDDFAYQCAYDLSKDWLYENASWDDVQIACKLGAKWYEEHHKVQWSEEDETNLTNTIIMLKEGASLHFTNSSITPCVDWLKQLKQRIGG